MQFPLDERQFYRLNLLGLFALGLILIVFWQYPRLDFFVSDMFFDRVSGRFINDHHWFWEGVMHEGVRKVMKIAHIAAFLAWIASFITPKIRPFRWALGYFLIASLTAVTIINVLKDYSDRACPFHLFEYGGKYEFVPFFSGLAEAPGIHCWPGGHILHALALLPIPFALHGLGRIDLAKKSVWILLVWTLLLNQTQLIRGQHFLSHHFWTLAICWLVSFFIYVVFGVFFESRRISKKSEFEEQ